MSKIISIIVILVLIGGGVYIVTNDSKVSVTIPVEQNVATTTPVTSTATSTTSIPTVKVPVSVSSQIVATSTVKTYSMVEVGAHASKTDCWSAINAKVYNLTSWIGNHPGGEQAILSICGKDGTAAFNGQHGGQGAPANVLTKFYLGELK
ncbi:MAG: cytochrome b5-like heme/steroid binding domain-containing protein [Patescibacteria group bacterium]